MRVGGIGKGLVPVPKKTAKILNLEFVEMKDLLPESWREEKEEHGKNIITLPKRKSAPLSILQWV